MQSKHTLGIYIASMHTAVTRFFNLTGLLSNLYILIFFLKSCFTRFILKEMKSWYTIETQELLSIQD
jgi:hypothetical protein